MMPMQPRPKCQDCGAEQAWVGHAPEAKAFDHAFVPSPATPADEAALREIAARWLPCLAVQPMQCSLRGPITCEVCKLRPSFLGALAKAHALGRASGWQAGAEAQRRADGNTAERATIDAAAEVRLAPLVTDDQRASVSGGRNADTGQEQRDPVACEVGLKPSGLSGSAPAETQVRPESATTTSKPSVSGERCARCGWERDHDPRCPSPDNKPTDRNARRDAALQHASWLRIFISEKMAGRVFIASSHRKRLREIIEYLEGRAVEAALKGGAR